MNKPKFCKNFNELEEEGVYWTNGTHVFYGANQIKGAAIDSFECFFNIWAKDDKNCFIGGTKLKNADVNTFSALNYTYAKDCESVWVLGGKIKGADVATFKVCDDGKKSLGKTSKYESFAPYGFGKDKHSVYYYNYAGKAKVVKKANPETFVSLNDGYFGYDDTYVYYGSSVIPKAHPKTWKKLKEDYFYSKDGTNVYYFNRLIKNVDVHTFKILETPKIGGMTTQSAKDKNTAYLNGNKISFEELNDFLEEEKKYYDE